MICTVQRRIRGVNPEGPPNRPYRIAPVGREGKPPSLRPARLALLGRVAARMARRCVRQGGVPAERRGPSSRLIPCDRSSASSRNSPSRWAVPPGPAKEGGREEEVNPLPSPPAACPGGGPHRISPHDEFDPRHAASVLGSVVHPRGRIRHKDPPSSALRHAARSPYGEGLSVSVLRNVPYCVGSPRAFPSLPRRATKEKGRGREARG